jgi:hypothetical protein
MTTVEVLRGAKVLLAGGWSPFMTRDAAGHICSPQAEGATAFDLHDALWSLNDADFETCLAAEHAVAKALTGNEWFWPDVEVWAQAPGRTLNDVLTLIGRAELRARTQERR